MFTGSVETVGIVSRLEGVSDGAQIEIYAPEFGRDLALGDTVLVNGAVLNIAAFERGAFVADVSIETLDRTSIGNVRPQDKVNLERSLRLSDRLAGSFVTGHVDGLGILRQRHVSGNATIYQFEIPENIVPYLIENGTITIEGVSLSIARMKDNMIAVSVAPIIEQTTILPLIEYDAYVNIEVDLIAKYVRRFTVGNEENAHNLDDYNAQDSNAPLSAKLRNFLDN